MWQLGILQKPLLSSACHQSQLAFPPISILLVLIALVLTMCYITDPKTHALSMASFAFIGYWLWRWDIRSTELLEEKKNQIATRQGYIRGL
jgi:hypothetical protein